MLWQIRKGQFKIWHESIAERSTQRPKHYWSAHGLILLLLHPSTRLCVTKNIQNLSPQAIRSKFTMATMALSEKLSVKG